MTENIADHPSIHPSAQAYWERYMKLGSDISDGDTAEETNVNDAIESMQALAKELAAEPIALQREFFETHVGSALGESNINEILDLAWDFYPRCDSSFFVSFDHLRTVAE